MTKHEPVLLKEVLRALFENQARPADWRGKYIDATLGAGGYTKAISEAGGVVLGIDADESMLRIAKQELQNLEVKLVQGNFRDIKKIAGENDFTNVDGVVYDLGVSNVHFADEKRGFSFKNPNALLDMRLDSNAQSIRAMDLLNGLRVDQLRQVFEEVLGRNEAFNFAKRVVAKRDVKKFETVKDLLEVTGEKRPGKIHPATKIFMALRIAVNSELDNLRESLPEALELLRKDGRIVVVSFHSLEDRIVKDRFGKWEEEGLGKVITSKPVVPSEEELMKNPKSRSAKLRVFQKL